MCVCACISPRNDVCEGFNDRQTQNNFNDTTREIQTEMKVQLKSNFNSQFQASINGLTGRIEFDEGKRNNFKIDLLKLKREQLVKVGYWTSNAGINITDPNAFYEQTMTNITLIVMTREVSISMPISQFLLSLHVRACVCMSAAICVPSLYIMLVATFFFLSALE